VQLLEQGLGTLAAVIAATTQVDVRTIAGGGAAGGIAASAVGLLGATLASGSDLLLRLVGLPAKLAGATLVITGEGSLDSQSLRGKAPHAVARLAAAHSVPVVAIVGRSTVTQHELDAAGIAQAYSIAAIETDPARQMAQAADLVSTLAERAAQQWLRDPGGQRTSTAGAPSDDQ
jgi:glycerate kinase